MEAMVDELGPATVLKDAQPKAQPMSTTPNLDNLLTSFGLFTERCERAAGKLANRMEAAGASVENSVTSLEAGVAKVEETAQRISEVATKLTNGGPPLGNSEPSSSG